MDSHNLSFPYPYVAARNKSWPMDMNVASVRRLFILSRIYRIECQSQRLVRMPLRLAYFRLRSVPGSWSAKIVFRQNVEQRNFNVYVTEFADAIRGVGRVPPFRLRSGQGAMVGCLWDIFWVTIT